MQMFESKYYYTIDTYKNNLCALFYKNINQLNAIYKLCLLQNYYVLILPLNCIYIVWTLLLNFPEAEIN